MTKWFNFSISSTFLQWFLSLLTIIKSVFHLKMSTSKALFECMMKLMPISKILGNLHIFRTDDDMCLLQMYISIKTNPSIHFSSDFHSENLMDESIDQRVSDYLKLCICSDNIKMIALLSVTNFEFYFLWSKKCHHQILDLKSICDWHDFEFQTRAPAIQKLEIKVKVFIWTPGILIMHRLLIIYQMKSTAF